MVRAPELRTRRLVLRPLGLDDAAQLQRIFPRWETVRLMAAHIPWPYPDDGARRFIRDTVLAGAGREWHWSIRPATQPGRLIGGISLMRRTDNNRGFWLDPDWRGRGLMGEASRAATDFRFDVLGEPSLRVSKAVANDASRAISASQGMRIVWQGELDYVSGRHPAELWEITAAEWRARRGVSER